ncbi:MAG: S-layer protein domain-containing protein, partial [Candidatus Methanoperedens sp.]|nr:S-layer protein domain-containing protein [Candidatus Methanoperedens sp.]
MSKKITAVALAALMLLVVTLPASATIKANSVEIRGTVATAATSWNASNFAGFWYDLKDDLQTENLNMISALTGSDNRTIPENSLWYNTSKTNKTLKAYANNHTNSELEGAFDTPAVGKYEIVGWQAMPYVAVNSKANKLAKLIIEQGNATAEKKTLTVGETWDIGD